MCHISPTSDTNLTFQDETRVLTSSQQSITITSPQCIHYASASLSEFNCNVVSYIAGFVVRRLLNIIKCVNCMEALVQHPTTTSPDLHLINLGDNGGLIYPPKDVVAVCKAAERCSGFTTETNPLRSLTYSPQWNAALPTK